MLAILAENTVALDYAAVGARLGPHCTARAVQERLKKLKKMAAEQADEGEAAEAGPVKSNGKVSKTVTKKPTQQPDEGEAAEAGLLKSNGKVSETVTKIPTQHPDEDEAAETSQVKGKGTAAKIVEKGGKSVRTISAVGPTKNGRKRDSKNFYFYDEESEIGGKRRRKDGEDKEDSTKDGNMDFKDLYTENQYGIITL